MKKTLVLSTLLAATVLAADVANADTYYVCDKATADAFMSSIMKLDRFHISGGQTDEELAIEERAVAIAAEGCDSVEGLTSTGEPYATITREGDTITATLIGDSDTVAISLSDIF